MQDLTPFVSNLEKIILNEMEKAETDELSVYGYKLQKIIKDKQPGIYIFGDDNLFHLSDVPFSALNQIKGYFEPDRVDLSQPENNPRLGGGKSEIDPDDMALPENNPRIP